MKFLVLLAALAIAKGQDCPPPTMCPDGMLSCAPPPPPMAMRDAPMCPPNPICFPAEVDMGTHKCANFCPPPPCPDGEVPCPGITDPMGCMMPPTCSMDITGCPQPPPPPPMRDAPMCPPPTMCPDGMLSCPPFPPPMAMRDAPMCPPNPMCFPAEVDMGTHKCAGFCPPPPCLDGEVQCPGITDPMGCMMPPTCAMDITGCPQPPPPRTVPNVFVNGNHIGGCDDTLKLHSDNKLMA